MIDSFIDRTTKREQSFYDGKTPNAPKGICHLPMDTPYSTGLRELFIQGAKELEIPHHTSGIAICIEGPRFSTKAESNVFRSWDGSVINMTTVPEVCIFFA